MFLCATSKLHIYIIKYHILGPEYREELVKIILSLSHSNDSASFPKKKNYYDSWELAPECVKAPQRWSKGQWLANAGTK